VSYLRAEGPMGPGETSGVGMAGPAATAARATAQRAPAAAAAMQRWNRC